MLEQDLDQAHTISGFHGIQDSVYLAGGKVAAVDFGLHQGYSTIEIADPRPEPKSSRMPYSGAGDPLESVLVCFSATVGMSLIQMPNEVSPELGRLCFRAFVQLPLLEC